MRMQCLQAGCPTCSGSAFAVVNTLVCRHYLITTHAVGMDGHTGNANKPAEETELTTVE